jgi:NTE family protein
VPRAVAASCAIPGYYQPIRIGGREYVDGGAWSQTNLDAAPAGRGTHVLCLNPIAGLPLALGTPLGAARRVMRSRLPIELAALRGRGARVRVIGPAHEPARAMQLNLMDPRPARDVLAGGYAQGLALGAS